MFSGLNVYFAKFNILLLFFIILSCQLHFYTICRRKFVWCTKKNWNIWSHYEGGQLSHHSPAWVCHWNEASEAR